MELRLLNTGLLKKSVEIISDLVLEGTFVFKKDYVELIALNSNNVVMVIFKLLATNFEKYEIKEEVKISLSLEHLNKILKSCSDNKPLILELKENNKLKLISEGENKKEFEISLLGITDDGAQKIPDLEFPTKIVTLSENLTNAINDLGFVDDVVNFKIEDKKFYIEGKTNVMGGKIEINDHTDIDSEKSEVSCKYSIEYLKKFIKTDKLVNVVEISFNDDYPLKLEYKLVDKLLLGFILAPTSDD